MPKGQKKKISINVETVENWQHLLIYVTTTMSFWKLDKEWPGNLIVDGIRNLTEEITGLLLDTQELPF